MKKQAPEKKEGEDIVIVLEREADTLKIGRVKLLFDGYTLYWKESANNASYTAFSGLADESAKESAKDLGPTPQGLYAVDPSRVQEIPPIPGGENPDWGSYRVPLEPYAATVDRMKNCFGVIRTGMYIHGGVSVGTIGCIELNDNTMEKDFFTRLLASGSKIELEVKYSGEREVKYEESKCPW